MKKTIMIPFIYAAIIILIFGGFMSMIKADKIPQIESRAELMRFDFSDGCALIGDECADVFNNMLLTPDEISLAIPNGESTEFEHYATYSFVLPVKEGVIYGITGKKSDYALNIYVDGVLLKSTGNVADNKADFVPAASAYEAFFTGKGETAQIVIQQANFNHYKHYGLYFTAGPAERIAEYNRQTVLGNIIIAVVLMTSFLINIGLFMCFPKKRELMHFSVLCLLAAINTTVPDITAFILPDLNWYISHKIEVSSMALMMLFLLFYATTIFAPYIYKHTKLPAIGVSAAVSALFILTPPAIYTRCNGIAIACIAISTLPLLVMMIRGMVKERKTISQSNKLAFLGIVFVAAVGYINAFGYASIKNVPFFSITTGFALFVFFNSIALSIDFRRANELLEQSEANERELSQTNELLVKLDKMKNNFLADLSHELKTPLTVIASNAAVASKQVSLGKTDEKTLAKLSGIEREAVRLGEMVERMKSTAMDNYSDEPEVLNLKSVLTSASDFCIPLCSKNGNTLFVDCDDDIYAFTSTNTIFHCLYNLISNATRHCKSSPIDIVCHRRNGCVVICVRDHGDGMNEDNMKRAFERGFSGDSGTGIGLSLCREMIENEGGTISLENTEGGGLTVSFTVKEAESIG